MTIALPAAWHAIPLALPPRGQRNDPVTRIVVASSPIRFGRGCNDVDYSFAATAVAVVVLEWLQPTPGRFNTRPRRFTPNTLPIHPAPAIECFDGVGGSVQFSERGRRFAAFLLLGRLASPALARRARAALDTLEVVKRRP